jgi:hypothetical protein
LFSGVFWDVQSVFPEDIERIEIISGPGAALWGPNAVNGVINIITRSTRDATGVVATASVGDVERAARLRYGGKFGDSATWRVYGMGFERDNTESVTGAPQNDDWHNLQGGFRIDGGRERDMFVLQVHYGRPGTGVELREGMIFTIEPMINAGKRHVKLSKKDGWTVETVDRRLSAQWEHMILVTADGHEVLTLRTEESL